MVQHQKHSLSAAVLTSVLAPTLFGIFFSLLFQYAFGDCDEGFTSTQEQMASSSTLPDFVPKRRSGVSSSANFCLSTTQPVSHSVTHLQRLVDRFAHACKEFGLTIRLKKTKVMAQDSDMPQSSPSMSNP